MSVVPADTNAGSQQGAADARPTPADEAAACDAPALAAIVANAVPTTHLVLRARLLRRLLMPIGPLALTVVADGAFVKYVAFARCSRISVSLDDAARLTTSQIVELVNYVKQSDPTVLEQVMVILSRDATTMTMLGASVAAFALQLASRRRAARGPTRH